MTREKKSHEMEVAQAAAHEAGKILMDNYGKVSARFKPDRSIVTDADIKSEETIKGILKKEFPDHSFLGEESGIEDKGSEYTWVVDPLDGTTNYSIKNPFFNVSIALAKGGQSVLGVVYYPFQEELFYAETGKGAYLNDERIHVSNVSRIRDSFVSFCHGHDAQTVERMVPIFRRIKLLTEHLRQIGASALELSYVACGRTGCFFQLKMNPWDVAAGSLIVSEAGGKVTDIVGAPYTLKSRDLVASNGLLHEELLGLLRPA